MKYDGPNPLGYRIRDQLKALVAAAIAGLTALEGAIPDGVDPGEWVGVALATLLAYAAVFGIRNHGG